jgi:hypothetical protein
MGRILEGYKGASHKFGWTAPGQPVTLTPKLSDMWFVDFHFADGKNQDRYSALANYVSEPSINVSSQALNQYGKRIHISTAVDFGPVNISFYDTVDGAMFLFASIIYDTYFKNNSLSTANADLDSTIVDINSGLKMRSKANGELKEHNTFRKVSIYHFFGPNDAANGGQSGFVQRIDLVNPLVTGISFDSHSYSNVAARNITFSFQPENVVYSELIEDVPTPTWIKQEHNVPKDEFSTITGNEKIRQQLAEATRSQTDSPTIDDATDNGSVWGRIEDQLRDLAARGRDLPFDASVTDDLASEIDSSLNSRNERFRIIGVLLDRIRGLNRGF